MFTKKPRRLEAIQSTLTEAAQELRQLQDYNADVALATRAHAETLQLRAQALDEEAAEAARLERNIGLRN